MERGEVQAHRSQMLVDPTPGKGQTWPCEAGHVGLPHRSGAQGTGSPPQVLTDPIWSCSQEPDYGALYEGRNPGFYVEANPMPTFKV